MQRYRVIDAFTSRPFSGNPAAVLLLDHPFDDAWAQAVAAEFNLSETAFCRTTAEDPDAAHELRWFTPIAEVALCGHATLATAHALVEEGVRGPYRFLTRSGTLVVTPGGDGMLWMDFPANPPQDAEAPRGLLAAVGGKPRWVGVAGTGDYLLEYADAATVRALRPDFGALEAVGMERDEQPFHPHITLARLRGADPVSVRQVVGAAEVDAVFPVTEFMLYCSELRREGSLHRVIARFPAS
jgi:predicted PhzF superfamily epimerase YddE/YHI9